jgi:hypothetical protein
VGLVLPAAAAADTIKATTISDISADDGECSLREAVTATNQNAPVNGANDCDHDGGTGKDTVKLPDGTLPLLGAANDNANASGDLDVEAGDGLTLAGKGSGDTTIDGDLDRILHLESGRLTLRGLTLSDGEAGTSKGGGALVEGDSKLTLDGSAVRLNSAETGGGIAVDSGLASLVVRDSTIADNLADGGAVFDDGGGIDFDGAKLVVDRSSIEANESTGGDGGAVYISGQEANLKISRSFIAGNHADARAAGGISHSSLAGRLTIARSLLVSNSARFAGGAIDVSNDANLTVVKSSAIVDNSLSSTQNEVIGGAGIANGGTAKMTGSIVAGNELLSPNSMASMNGAGVRNDNGAEMTISSSLITANEQPEGQGAGIFSVQPLELSNSTISDNDVGTGSGGGLSASFAPAVLSHVTFAGNQAGGQGDAIHTSSNDITMRASIVAEGAGACGQPINSLGYNLDAGTSCDLDGPRDVSGSPVQIKSLKEASGPPIGPPGFGIVTGVHPLKRSSEAVDSVPKRKCKDAAGKRLRADQRGVKRPQGGRCDAGAYERKR